MQISCFLDQFYLGEAVWPFPPRVYKHRSSWDAEDVLDLSQQLSGGAVGCVWSDFITAPVVIFIYRITYINWLKWLSHPPPVLVMLVKKSKLAIFPRKASYSRRPATNNFKCVCVCVGGGGVITHITLISFQITDQLIKQIKNYHTALQSQKAVSAHL